MLRILIFILLPFMLLAQSSNWNSVVDLNLSLNSTDRTDLYTNKDGNHILVENGSTLKYYLYSPTGTQIRSYTVDGSISATYSKVTGWENTVYVSYKEGSKIYTKISTDAGQNWTNINDIDMDESESDGLELWSDSNGLHITYSEYDISHYELVETKYKLSQHLQSTWINDKTVTDESGLNAGKPSITSSSGRVHVAFDDTENYEVNSRDKNGTSWETSQEVNGTNAEGIYVIATSGKLHALYGKINVPSLYLYYKNRDVSSSTWSTESLIATDFGSSEYIKPDMTVTDNDKLHIVYNYGSVDSYYREWVTSMSSDFDFTPYSAEGGNSQRISSQENDVYTIWFSDSDDKLKMRQRDYDPLVLTNFADSWSSNHPKVTWDESEATDFKQYVVEKSTNGTTFTACTTLTSRAQTSFIDQGEFQYSRGNDKTYVYYRVKQVDLQDNESDATSSKQFAVNATQQNVATLDFSQDLKLNKYQLSANYPNPFNPETKISFGLPEQSSVSLKVYNIQGKEVATLVVGSQESGFYKATFNATDLTSGVYIYRFTAKGLESGKRFSEIKRMLLIK